MANEASYEAVSMVDDKVVDQLIPGPTPSVSKEIKVAAKHVVGMFEGALEKETDKTVERFKEK